MGHEQVRARSPGFTRGLRKKRAKLALPTYFPQAVSELPASWLRTLRFNMKSQLLDESSDWCTRTTQKRAMEERSNAFESHRSSQQAPPRLNTTSALASWLQKLARGGHFIRIL